MKIQTLLVLLCLFMVDCSADESAPVARTELVDGPASRFTVLVSENPAEQNAAEQDVAKQNAAKQNATEHDADDTRGKQFAQLVEAHEAAFQTRNAALRQFRGDAAKGEIARNAYTKQDFPQQFMDFALAKNDDASLESCRHVISRFYISKLRYAAIEHVIANHLNKQGMDEFYASLAHNYALDRAADKCLKAGMSAEAAATRAHATYQLALINVQRRNWCLDSAEEKSIYVDALGKEDVDHLLSDAGTEEIVDLLQQVIAEYPSESFFGYSMKQRAEQSLFTLTRLEVGCEVPEVIGKDSSGRTLKLQDQRGNVVVICFWAHWCGVCMDSLPRETEFVQSMKGRPFRWIGVNGDDDVELLRKVEKSGTVNFPSWHDGQEGAIATGWNIWGFPALFVIDQNGIIQYKSRGHVDLDVVFPVVEKLVSDVESENESRISK